jgi:hypothetical protein
VEDRVTVRCDEINVAYLLLRTKCAHEYAEVIAVCVMEGQQIISAHFSRGLQFLFPA